MIVQTQDKARVISAEDVDMNAHLKELVETIKDMYLNHKNEVEVPQRSSIIRHNPFRAFDIMPAYSEKHQLFITKIGAVIPKTNDSKNVSVNTSLVAFSARTGEIIATFDGDSITRLKCAAITALVTDICAPTYAKTMGLIGTGVQAAQQITGVKAVRDIETIKVFSRNVDRVQNFIQKQRALYPEIAFEAALSAEEAASNVQVLSTATTAFEPIISSQALVSNDLHINCIGNHIEESREIPRAVLEDSFVVVEDRKTAVLEAGAVHEKATEVGDLVQMNREQFDGKRTIFSSTGHAFLDVITVAHLLEKLDIVTRTIK